MGYEDRISDRFDRVCSSSSHNSVLLFSVSNDLNPSPGNSEQRFEVRAAERCAI